MATAAEPLAVTTRTFAEVGSIPEVSAPAEVVALTRSRVPARLSATIEEVAVEVGDRVEQGDLLARLDCSDFTDRVDEIEGRLAELEAERTLALTRSQRTRRLREQGVVSQEALDEATAEQDSVTAAIRSERSRLRAAQRDVRHCRVQAPFAGVITARAVTAGEWIGAGGAIVTLNDVDAVELAADVPAGLLQRVPLTGPLAFRVDGESHAAELRDRGSEIDPATRTREVRLRLPGTTLIPGTTGRLHWQRGVRAVPAELIVRRGGRLGVMVVRDGIARFHELPDAVAGRPAAAPALATNARLIVEGRHAARPGQSVAVRSGGGDAD